MTSERDLMRIVIVGHVDHGKSTLIGRLLYDTDSLPEGKFEELEAISRRRGMALEWSFVLDAFQAERDQAVTIDTTQIWFKTALRDYVIIDAPGHREFLKNMVSGAASADAAVVVVDAAEGVREQSRRHAYLLHLLGIRQVAVVVNKMDLVDFSQARFDEVSKEITDYLASIGATPLVIVPISAREGDNIARRSDRTPWYDGPTVLSALDGFHGHPGVGARVTPTAWPAPAVSGHRSSGQASIVRIRAVLLDGENSRVSPTDRLPLSMRPAMMRRASNL